MRPLPKLQAVANGKVVATRNVESKFGALGGTKKSHPQYDATISYYADAYGIPPHFLKAQAIRESDAYRSDFRFEFTSINLTRLSGDGNTKRAFNGSQPLIQAPPFSLYLVAPTGKQGMALRSYRPGTNDAAQARKTQPFLYDPQNPSETQFGLGVAVKRTVGPALSTPNAGFCRFPGPVQPGYRPYECEPRVSALLQDISGPTPLNLQQLKLVHRDTVWQRNGHTATLPLTSSGVDALAKGQNVLQPDEFAIDYNSGTITTGAPLGKTQRLSVSYWPVGTTYNDNSGQPTVVGVSAGTLAAGAPDLNAKFVRELDKLHYNPGETLFDFLKKNVVSDRGNKWAFLTTPDTGDFFVEFAVDGNNNPVQPRDPRYQFITSQPYASSSYGLLQLTLLPFGKGTQLTQAFDPSSGATPIYQLLTRVDKNFDLAAHFHQITLSQSPKLGLCTPTNCNKSLWEQEWTGIIRLYNKDGAGYADGGIVKNGANVYAPSEPQ